VRGRYSIECRRVDTLLYSRVRMPMVSNTSVWPVPAGFILPER
jgi:hypothetical protein